jgi:translation initiation factor 1
MTAPRARLVYSTDNPTAGKPAKAKPPHKAVPSSSPAGLKPGVVYVERSRKGRGGKTVTLVLNLPGNDAAKTALLKDLKAACGAGGALKDGQLELQGDHRERLLGELAARGFTVKARGG